MGFLKNITRRFTKDDESSGEVHYRRGEAALDAGAFAQAATEFEQAIALGMDPAQMPEAYSCLGGARFQLNQMEQAIAAFAKAVELDPQRRKDWNNLGVACWRAGKFDEAIHAHEQALRIAPNDAHAYSDLGAVYLSKGQVDQATELLEKAVQLDPQLAVAHSNLAEAYAIGTRFEDSYAAISKAVSAGYPDPCGLKIHIDMIKALYALHGGERERSWRELLEEAKPDPDNADITSLRYAYALSKEYDPFYQEPRIKLAIQRTEEAVESGDWQRVIEASTAVLAMNYMHLTSHSRLIDAYLSLGQEQQAVPHQHFVRSCIRSIYQSGYGQDYRTAYVVISPDEEQFFTIFSGAMEKLEYQRPRRYVEHEGCHFDVFEVLKEKTGEKSEIYLNVELVFKGVAEGRAKPASGVPIFSDELQLPHRLAGLDYAELEVYSDQQLGARIRYTNASGVKADAYLYNLGLTSIPTDLRATEVVKWFREACNDVFRYGQEGHYLDLQVRASRYLHIPQNAPEPFCLWAAFQYRQAPGPETAFEGQRMSHLALRTDRGYINKVRFTYPESMEASAFPVFLAFLQEWTHAVQSHRSATSV